MLEWFVDVTPPDDSLGSVDNSVYTNAVASLSLHYAKYAACMCNIDVNTFAPYEWIVTAQNLYWPYNNTMNFNPESKDFLSSGRRVYAIIFIITTPVSHLC